MRNSQESLQGRGGCQQFELRDKAPSEHMATQGSLSALEPFSYCTPLGHQPQSHRIKVTSTLTCRSFPPYQRLLGGSRPFPVPRPQHPAGGILHEQGCQQEQRPLGGGHTHTWGGRSKQREQPVQRPRGGQSARTRQSRQVVRAGQEPQDWPASTVCLTGPARKLAHRIREH